METWIGIIGTLNVVLLSWLSIEVRRLRDKLDRKADKEELKECWDRINCHKHQDNTGEVIIPRP